MLIEDVFDDIGQQHRVEPLGAALVNRAQEQRMRRDRLRHPGQAAANGLEQRRAEPLLEQDLRQMTLTGSEVQVPAFRREVLPHQLHEVAGVVPGEAQLREPGRRHAGPKPFHQVGGPLHMGCHTCIRLGSQRRKPPSTYRVLDRSV